MKVYIATGLTNKHAHNDLRDALVQRGHTITYDWTRLSDSGPAYRFGAMNAERVGTLERNGVRDADVVVMLQPGGRGTHVELGMALAYGKPVVLWCGGECCTPDAHIDYHRGMCVFYYQKNVVPVCRCKVREFTDVPTALIDAMENACKTP